jgi:amino acid adenylation domain-containing protein
VDWNQTRTQYPSNSSLPELFEQQTKRRPDAPALVFGDRRLTYGELNVSANQVAHGLARFGIRRGAAVGICMECSPELLIGILGILKTGAAYAPLDPALPRNRLLWMLQDLDLSFILCDQQSRGKLLKSAGVALGPARLLCPYDEWKTLAYESTRNLRCPVRSTDGAYISFTSGSTGRPKGVCVPHRAIVRLVRNTNWATFAMADTFLQMAPVAFDASLLEIWGSLLNGARLVLPRRRLPTFSELASLIKEEHVTIAWFTSGLFNQLVEQIPEALTQLRVAVTGGDVASPAHVKRALRFLGHGRLVNGYGPTENCTFSTTYTVPQDFDGLSAVPIGRPVANSQCYVLDSGLEPVGLGRPGELYVGGDGLALGYLNRPELNAERFVPNPFESGTRLYRTGDLGRYRQDGNLEFLGRIDAQVKVRGYRVEPAEVELVLQQHPGIRACAVLGKEGPGGGKELIAYVVPRRRAEATPADYREFLRCRLPDYMVPAFYTTVGELPLSPNGKLDRRTLPDLNLRSCLEQRLESQPSAADRETGEPRERKLRQLWEEVLDVHPVGPDDNFFSLGGHSLLAMRLVERIRVVLGVELPVASVFDNPTPQQMSRALRGGGEPEVASALVEIQPKGQRPPLYLVHGAGGGMFWGYSNLARHLGSEQPVLAFKSRGLDGLAEWETINDLAAAYVAELRTREPRGPYRLGGYCFGGLVAYEMARRLGSENVALLALINSYPPNSNYTRLQGTPAGLARFAFNIGVKSFYALLGTPQRWPALVRWKLRTCNKRLKRLLSRRGGISSEMDPEFWQDMAGYSSEERRLWQTHVRAFANYQPKPYAGRLVLFRSPSHLLFSSFDRQYGWGEFCQGGVQVQSIPGGHDSIMQEPLVERLGAELEIMLAQAAQP